MFLVPADRLQRQIRRKNGLIHEDKKHLKPHLYEKWVKMRQKMGEAVIRQKTETKAIANFLRRVMPTSSELARKATPPHLLMHLKRRAAGRRRN